MFEKFRPAPPDPLPARRVLVNFIDAGDWPDGAPVLVESLDRPPGVGEEVPVPRLRPATVFAVRCGPDGQAADVRVGLPTGERLASWLARQGPPRGGEAAA